MYEIKENQKITFLDVLLHVKEIISWCNSIQKSYPLKSAYQLEVCCTHAFEKENIQKSHTNQVT